MWANNPHDFLLNRKFLEDLMKYNREASYKIVVEFEFVFRSIHIKSSLQTINFKSLKSK